jgi:Zn-dependent peptidase ImmA (M78 family)
VAFLVSHEVAHVVAADCQPDRPVVDEQDEVPDDAAMERRADRFATQVLVGGNTVPQVEADNARDLARTAARIEGEKKVDAGAIAFAWAHRSRDYATATSAVKALYRASGARRLLRRHFDQWVDLDAATESDRTLLRCVYGDPTADAHPD